MFWGAHFAGQSPAGRRESGQVPKMRSVPEMFEAGLARASTWWLRLLRWAVLVFIVIVLGLPLLRQLAPTHNGWRLFPLSYSGVISQNFMFWASGRTYGRRDVYDALVFSAQKVQQAHPGAYLAYLDVSARRGGQLRGHLSHRRGRDVDLLLLGKTQHGTPIPNGVSFSDIGYALKYDCKTLENSKGHRLDAAKNWQVLMALRANPHSRVERIFLEPCLKDWLLQFAETQGASAEEMAWVEKVVGYAGKNSADHLDHMHIRFSQRADDPRGPRS